MKKIKSALISVFYKNGLDEIVKELHKNGVHIYTLQEEHRHLLNH